MNLEPPCGYLNFFVTAQLQAKAMIHSAHETIKKMSAAGELPEVRNPEIEELAKVRPNPKSLLKILATDPMTLGPSDRVDFLTAFERHVSWINFEFQEAIVAVAGESSTEPEKIFDGVDQSEREDVATALRISPNTAQNKIDVAQRNLQLQISKLEGISHKIKEKHDSLFNKIVSAQKANNILHAKAYATELSEIKKMHNMINNAKLSLEQIQIRLNTVSELGDIVVTLSPCMSVMKGLGASITGIMPEATSSMQDLSQILGDVLTGSSMNASDTTISTYSANSDTLAILEEAQSVIEGQARASIPEPPASVASGQVRRESII